MKKDKLNLKNKIKYWLPYVFLFFFSIPLLLIIRLLHPLFTLRISHVKSERIGHFATELEIYLCMKDAQLLNFKKKTFDIFFHKETCNHQLLKMFKRIIPFFWGKFMWPIYKANKILNIKAFDEFMIDHRDLNNLLDRSRPHVSFTPEEIKYGEDQLRSFGLPKDAKIVCLSVRDKSYLDTFFPGKDWSHHNYRDSDIDNYILAAEELASRGYFVFRMGAKVLKPFNTKHTNIIDYATLGIRSEFMDIYLASKCEFSVGAGNNTGNTAPWLFRKPAIVQNMVPIGHFPTFSRLFLILPKKHFDNTKNRDLKLSEIVTSGACFFSRDKDFKSNNIKLIENTPEEIRDSCIEMDQRLNGKWIDKKEDLYIQEKFWSNFKKNVMSTKDGILYHGQLTARFGTQFLKSNPNWLE